MFSPDAAPLRSPLIWQVPKPDEDTAAFALHESPALGGSGSGHDQGFPTSGHDHHQRTGNSSDFRGVMTHGVRTLSNGDVYAGELVDDAMEGYGVYVFANKGRYEGQWAAALCEGVGAETFACGTTYRGEYSKGLRAGLGICR